MSKTKTALKDTESKTGAAGSEQASPGFSESMEELTAIVQSIEDDQTDIDGLAAALHRASELLELCRDKIRKVDLEVTQIVQRFEGTEASGADSAAGEE